jgi:hypothetical protein
MHQPEETVGPDRARRRGRVLTAQDRSTKELDRGLIQHFAGSVRSSTKKKKGEKITVVKTTANAPVIDLMEALLFLGVASCSTEICPADGVRDPLWLSFAASKSCASR